MNTFKKTIFLSNKHNSKINTLSTLTLEKKNSSIFCTIKCYNDTPQGNLLLGIQSGNKIIKQNVSFENNPYNFILTDSINLNETINCVLVDNNSDDFKPILWGKENKENQIQLLHKLKENISKLNRTKKVSTSTTNNENKIDDKNISDEITDNNNLLKTENDKEIFNENFKKNPHENHQQISLLNDNENKPNKSSFDEVAVAQASLFEYSESEIENEIDNAINKDNSSHKFYNMISSQIDELFEKYPREFNLEKLIDDSQWVKINHDYDNKYYVVGIIYEDNDIKYICYGVPGKYNQERPMELVGYSQWLPTDVKDPYNNGYWVMYQDADTGENINIE